MRLPVVLTPRVVQNFVLQKVSTNFVLKELSKLKVTKAFGPDGLTARLLKDAAPVIAKPITYLVNPRYHFNRTYSSRVEGCKSNSYF